jgi:hypothetical protein
MGGTVREQVGPAPTQASRSLYLVLVLSGGLLSVAQVAVLPVLLDVRGFAVVLLTISATQGSVLLSDLGFITAAFNVTASAEERAGSRHTSYAVACCVISACCAALAVYAILVDTTVPVAIALGCLCGAPLMRSRLKASECELAGDEVGALKHGWRWQNAPKIGMLLACVFRDPLWVALGGLVSSAMICGLPRPELHALRARTSEWMRVPARLNLVGSPFLVAWADSFFLARISGLTALGVYGFAFRIVFASSYLYGPMLSLNNARSRQDPRLAVKGVVRVALLCCPVLPLLALVVHTSQPMLQGRGVGWVPLGLLSISSLCLAMSDSVGRVLIQWGGERLATMASFTAAMTTIAVSVALIPGLGILGAAIASLSGNAVAAAIQGVGLRRVIRTFDAATTPPQPAS